LTQPAELGYRMPPEWAPHRGTWLSWPHRESSWPGKFDAIPTVFGAIVEALAPHEEVHINVTGPEMEAGVRHILDDLGVPPERICLHHHPTNDAWCRDHGPTFVQRVFGGLVEEAIVDWGYNSWGNKYPPFDLDDAIPARIGSTFGIRVFQPGIVLEGGSIDVNGAGTLLTTEACLLNPNRNPDLPREEIEQHLREYLGVVKILWLGDGISGDDTDGHVDDIVRFVNPTTVVATVEDDPSDENFEALQENLHRLEGMTDQDSRPIRVIPLPMPPPLYYEGERLPASYANFYIANGVVLVPAYEAVRDEVARQVLQPLFPTRRVTLIESRDLVWGLGSVHCVTQQWPAC
jgi:agmatine deiminase